MTFTEWLDENWEKDNMFPPCLDPQIALNFLQQYLLGEDWYIADPVNNIQANLIIVYEIERKYKDKNRKKVIK